MSKKEVDLNDSIDFKEKNDTILKINHANEIPLDTIGKKELSLFIDTIQNNFERINSIRKWKKTETIDIYETLEGGTAVYYFSNSGLEKIVTRHYGETYQQQTSFYLLHGKLSFVFEKFLTYNRPITYDSLVSKESNDPEFFDLKKSKVMEKSTYYENDFSIFQKLNEKINHNINVGFLFDEEMPHMVYFNKLLKLMTKKN